MTCEKLDKLYHLVSAKQKQDNEEKDRKKMWNKILDTSFTVLATTPESIVEVEESSC